MTDAEQIEAWRKEHKSILLGTGKWCLADFKEIDGSYYDWHLQASWEGFLMAKRSQPVIFLPCKTYDDGHPVSDGYNLALKHCKEAILSSGYSYQSEG